MPRKLQLILLLLLIAVVTILVLANFGTSLSGLVNSAANSI